MSTLTEKFKRLQEMEKELDEAITWFEQNADQLKGNLTLSAAREGRNVFAPMWLADQINTKLNQQLIGAIEDIITDRAAELSTLEKEFAQAASDTLAEKEGAISRTSERMLKVSGFGGKKE
jgi:hypothetical protein